MLQPEERILLLESLRPPEGFRLARAIGTTYSLDLLALLTTPLAFTLFDWQAGEGDAEGDPLLLLEAIRRYADCIHLFCQAGGIHIPAPNQRLISYLENSVFQVEAPAPGGVFHPKIWVLRFTAEEGTVLYRFLCLTRNLTFDRSWDAALVLEGTLQDRQRAYARNHPVGDFLAALPKLTVRPLPDEVLRAVNDISQEIRRVDFELPDGFEELAFHPLGLPGGKKTWPFQGDVRRLLVISPFLSASCLKRLTLSGTDHLLISRPEALEAISRPALASFARIRTLSDGAHLQEEGAGSESDPVQSPDTGLHAKVYVADAGWDSRVWVGSANATTAAFEQNVEFLVELVGKKSICGIDVLLSSKGGATTFDSLLEDFHPSDTPTTADPDQRRFAKLTEEARHALCSAGLRARVKETGESLFDVAVQVETGPLPLMPTALMVSTWPVTLGPLHAVRWPEEQVDAIRFAALSFEALTCFFAIQFDLSIGGRPFVSRFALGLELLDAPVNRRERLLRSILKDREQLMRLILLLLTGGDGDAGAVIDLVGPRGAGRHSEGGFAAVGMLESLVRTLARRPERLDEVADLLASLRADPVSADLVPDDFEAIWGPIWEARLKMKDASQDGTH